MNHIIFSITNVAVTTNTNAMALPLVIYLLRLNSVKNDLEMFEEQRLASAIMIKKSLYTESIFIVKYLEKWTSMYRVF